MRKWICFPIALILVALSGSALAQTFQLVGGDLHASAFAGPNDYISGTPNPPDVLLAPGGLTSGWVAASETAIDGADSVEVTGSFTISGGVSNNGLGVSGSGHTEAGFWAPGTVAGGSGTFSATVALSSPATISMNGTAYNTSGISSQPYSGGSVDIKDSQGNTLYDENLTDIYSNPTLFLFAGTYTFNVYLEVFPSAGTGGGGAASFSASVPEPASAVLCSLVAVLAIRRRRRSNPHRG